MFLRVIQVTSDLDERLQINHLVNSSDARPIREDAQWRRANRGIYFRAGAELSGGGRV